jgi:hypothetical protein
MLCKTPWKDQPNLIQKNLTDFFKQLILLARNPDNPEHEDIIDLAERTLNDAFILSHLDKEDPDVKEGIEIVKLYAVYMNQPTHIQANIDVDHDHGEKDALYLQYEAQYAQQLQADQSDPVKTLLGDLDTLKQRRQATVEKGVEVGFFDLTHYQIQKRFGDGDPLAPQYTERLKLALMVLRDDKNFPHGPEEYMERLFRWCDNLFISAARAHQQNLVVCAAKPLTNAELLRLLVQKDEEIAKGVHNKSFYTDQCGPGFSGSIFQSVMYVIDMNSINETQQARYLKNAQGALLQETLQHISQLTLFQERKAPWQDIQALAEEKLAQVPGMDPQKIEVQIQALKRI